MKNISLPENWSLVKLGQIGTFGSGGTPSKKNASFWDGNIPFVTGADITKLYISAENARAFLTEKGLHSGKTALCKPDTILIVTRTRVGRVGIATEVMGVSQDLSPFTCSSQVLPEYLCRYLATLKDDLISRCRGSTIMGLTRDIVENLEIPLPPIAEQKRIAAILDKADAIRRKRKEAIRLTEELQRSLFLEMFGDPVTNPKGWENKLLEEVVDPETIVTYGIVQAGPNVENGIPYIRTGDIKNGYILENELLKTTPEIAQKYKRSEVHAGDLVISIRATVGTVAEVPYSLNGANLTQGTAKISPGSQVKGSYLLEFIRSNGCQQWIQRQVKGATFREITLKRLREMPVMLPPLTLQSEFDQFVQFMKTENDKYSQAKSSSENLFNSLFQRAFRGEL